MPSSCSLWLDVYEDDRESIAFTVTTERGPVLDYDEDYVEPRPYLIDPMRYGEQQIDVAKGAATIGTITVGVIDPAQIPGDQDSGWMTERLARVAGHRCRLRRYIDAAYVVIADGPGGEPRLEPDYASYTWEIRDTRETERKVRAFVDVEPTTSVWPRGVIAGFGTIPPVTPNVGTIKGFFPGIRRIDFGDYWATGAGTPAADGSTVVDPEAVVTQDVEALFLPSVTLRGDGLYQYTYDGLTIMYRETGSGDPWTVVRPPYFLHTSSGNAQPLFLVRDGTLADGRSVRAIWRSAILSAFDDEWSAVLYTLPLNTALDVLIVAHGPASKVNPVHIEGLTAGEFAKNAYDGVYSPRDADGAIVPSGLRYDEATLLAMTDPVSIRLFEPINDLRDALEKFLYTPTGHAPALNDQARISPVSQVAPDDDYDLPVINNAITEPRPSWGAGSRVINILRFVYPRDYVPDPTINVPTTGDGLAERRVEIEFRDEASIVKHGEQVLEIDGRWFRATGTAFGGAIDDDETAETGSQLAQLRNTHAKGRYVNGAPSFSVAVMRSGTLTVRAGSYVAVDLPWLPDPFVTGRRGLTGIAQVMSIAELDCAWREALLEMLPPPPEPPAAIMDLAAVAFSHARIDLAWTLPDGATGVRLHRSTVGGFTPGGGNLIATLGAVEAYEDTSGIAPSTAYYYRAIAFSDAGDAAASNEATATTPAEPTPPTLDSATRTEIEDADLCAGHTWTHRIAYAVSDPDDTNYEINIERATNSSGSNWATIATGLSTVSGNYDDITGVSGNLSGSLEPLISYRKYRASLVPRGGGATVDQIETSQDTVTVYADACA